MALRLRAAMLDPLHASSMSGSPHCKAPGADTGRVGDGELPPSGELHDAVMVLW